MLLNFKPEKVAAFKSSFLASGLATVGVWATVQERLYKRTIKDKAYLILFIMNVVKNE
jgi:hypothetical protein